MNIYLRDTRNKQIEADYSLNVFLLSDFVLDVNIYIHKGDWPVLFYVIKFFSDLELEV